MKALLDPYRYLKIILPPPEKQPFAEEVPRNFLRVVQMAWRYWRNPDHLKAEALYNEGFRSFGFGFFKEARAAFGQCLLIDPQHLPALVNDGAAAFYLDDFQDAEARWQRAIQLAPKNAKALFNLGVSLFQQEKIDEAREIFQQVLVLYPRHFQANVALAEILMNRNQLEDALKYYEAVLDQKAWAHAVHLRCSEIHQLLEQYDQAERHVRILIADRSEPEYLYNLGWLLAAQKKDLDQAIQSFAEADRRKVGFEEALINRAVLLSLTERFEESVGAIRQMVRKLLQPENQVQVHLERILKANPKNDVATMALAHWYMDRDLWMEAFDILKKAVVQFPEKPDFAWLLAKAYVQHGQWDSGERTLKRILARFPEYAPAFGLIGRIYAQKKDFSQAALLLERAVALDPNDLESRYGLGLALAQLKRFNEALTHFEAVFNQNQQFPLIQNRIREVKEELEVQPQTAPGEESPIAPSEPI
ncbi:MAG: tetratricopeptide repeat protein [Acidobacteria bacterium]|nr:tetratricopeptide repeat protein [Acidobacteriota bacterium]